MAKLTREEVLNLARLARLHLSEDEIVGFQNEISTILGYVEQLHDVDLGKLKPTYQVTGLTNATRADKVVDYRQTQTELLKNVPQTESGQIKVRRML